MWVLCAFEVFVSCLLILVTGTQNRHKPTRVEALAVASARPVALAAGDHHSVALSGMLATRRAACIRACAVAMDALKLLLDLCV